jgi:hypothetical protein
MNVRNIVVSLLTPVLLTVVLSLAGCQSSSRGQLDDNVSAMHVLKHSALGCHLYAQDNDGVLPRAMIDLKPYVDESFDPNAYELVISGRLADVEHPAEAVLIRQKKTLRDGRQAVAFVDGHAAIVSRGRDLGDVRADAAPTPESNAKLRKGEQHAVIAEDWGSLS